MEQSMQVLEWQAAAKADDVLRVLRKRFPGGVSPVEEQLIRSTIDIPTIDRWLDAAAGASSLAEFRQLAGLTTKRNGRQKRNKTDRGKRG